MTLQYNGGDMRKIFLGFACTVAILMASSYSAFANFGFPDSYGVSLRSMSMGRAFTAIADNYSAVFHNPAGLGQLTTTSVEFDIIQPFHSLDVTYLDNGADVKFYNNKNIEFSNPTKGSDGDSLDVRFPVFGATLNINRLLRPKVDLPVNTTMGIAASLTGNFNGVFTTNTSAPDMPNFTAFGDPIEHFQVIIGLGFEIKENLLYLGWSGMFGATIHSPTPMVVHDVYIGDEVEDLILQMDSPVYTEMANIVGVLFTPLDKKLKIGASYREKLWSVKINFLPLYAYVDPGQNTSNTRISVVEGVGYIPEQYSFGIAYTFDVFTVSFDVKQKMWSDYPYTLPYKVLYVIDEADVIRTNTGYPALDDPDFDDVTDMSVGFEYKYSKNLTFTAGYEYYPTPVPDQSYKVTNYLDMDKNIFSFGVSWKVNGWFKLGGLFQYMMLEDFKVYKTGNEGGYSWGWDEDNRQRSYKVEGDAIVIGLSVEFAL
jgi:long-subunit fatty acid transport protein